MDKKTVFLVEDSTATREALKQLLADFYGYEVVACVDGANAIALLGAKKPHIDAAILDIMMRGHGGAVRDYLRSLPEYRGVHIIYHTSLSKEQVDNRLLEGAHFVEKGKDSIPEIGKLLRRLLG